MTNFEKIKAMTVEEVANALKLYRFYEDFVCCLCCNNDCIVNNSEDCKLRIKKWLESEVEE